MKNYDHKKIESKWQKDWDKKGIYKAESPSSRAKLTTGRLKRKFYALIEFPYPSGAGLHVGHVRSNTAMDIISRKRRMEGYNVLYPIGWDAFGLPTENYAIKTGIPPAKVTKQNTDTFRRQLKSFGFSFDWSREINTTDPTYYKWTQWIFLQMFKKDLAYKKKTVINWCPSCKIGLANEEVIDGKCERCGADTVKKEKEQWMLAITKYADRLDKDLDDVDYLERIKIGQRNWIGKSEGSELKFRVVTDKIFSSGPRMREEEMPDQLGKDIIDSNSYVKIFTTRADTLFGATYVVLAPEHELVEKLKNQISNWSEVKKYIEKIKNETDIDRTALDKEKIGVELKGVKAINPATEKEIPIWIADYVLASYGTGAVMAVPAHDERDFEFAKKYNLSIVQVVSGGEINDRAYTDDGILINSGKFNKMTSGEARKKITEEVGGKMVTKFKLRDWIFSRQRYWGEPIPIIHCEKCGYVPVPEKDLPLVLPKVKSYTPTDNGESPLATISKWVNVKCPKCKGKAQRETDTMPNWAGSSWYYLRYIDPKNKKEFASQKNLKYWLGACPVRDREGSQRVPISNGVDWYNGGMEHTTLHLLYSRFWHKFLYDLKLVPTKEPYQKRTAHGMILAEDGEKMSKSRGNVINPDEIIKLYGADTLRIYEMFIGPFDQTAVWNTNSIIGSRRFIEKVWRLGQRVASPDTVSLQAKSMDIFSRSGSSSSLIRGPEKISVDEAVKLQTILHKTIKKVSEDIESMSFNTAISSMMILANEIEVILNKGGDVKKDDFKKFLQILSPFAPHTTEELWEILSAPQDLALGSKKARPFPTEPKTKNQQTRSIHLSGWPKWDKKKIIEEEVKIAVQVNGKVRAEIMVSKDMTEEEVKSLSLKEENIMAWVKGKEIKKFIYIPGRIINFVVI